MFKRLRENRAEVQKAAKTLLAAKRLESSKGETKKDVMSLLRVLKSSYVLFYLTCSMIFPQ